MLLVRDLWATSPRRVALVGVLVMIGAVGLAVVAPLTGAVLAHRSAQALVLLAVALLAKVTADLVVGLVAADLTADWSADLRRRLCRTAFGRDLPSLEVTPVGELLDRIDGDAYQVAAELRGPGLRIAQAVTTGVAAVITTFLLWWPAGVGMCLAVALVFLALRGRVSRIGAARVREEEAWSALAAVMEESIYGQDDVRTSLGQPYVLQLYADRASAVLRLGRVVWRLGAIVTTIAATLSRIAIAAVVVAGAWALATGAIDAARLTALWLLTIGFGLTVEHITRMVPELQDALGAWSRVQQLAASAQERSGNLDVPDGDLEVRDLSFTYPVLESATEPSRPGDRLGAASRRPAALHGVSLRLRRGHSYAVIGRTGSGKSTLAKALVRAIDVPRGRVLLGGVDVLDLDLDALRRWVAVVPQRTEILAGSLAENIALFDDALLAQVPAAVEELGLTDWVATLPDGLDTRLGDGGHKLSAGQEQLVAFARILVRDPHVVILDEATARLDPVTEARVHRATRRLLAGRIGILIAHRLSSLRQCDEVVVLAAGRVVEAGPMTTSVRFAELLADSATATDPAPADPVVLLPRQTRPPRAEVPQLPPTPPARTLREVVRLTFNDPRYGMGAVALFLPLMILGLEGSVLPVFWSRLVDGTGGVLWPTVALVVGLLVTLPTHYFTGRWFPEWWVRQMLRIGLRLVHGQTGPRRVSEHTPAEVVAQGGDTERVVQLADNVLDQLTCALLLVVMSLAAGSPVPALFFGGTMAVSGLAAAGFGTRLAALAQNTVSARAAFATALVSSLSAARTVKLSGASRGVLDHLARLDTERSARQRREIRLQVWARSTPSIVAGLAPIGVWVLYLSAAIGAAPALVAVSTLGAAGWFAWTTASLVSALPSARVWTRRTVAMSGVTSYSAPVSGVDLSAGTAPAPVPAARERLSRLELRGLAAVHEDGTVGVSGVDLVVERGELVLVVGPVGSGKSSLLRAMAGVVHHTGSMRWNGQEVTDPPAFLRPNQVAYVGQLPRVLSGTVAENIALGHSVDARHAVATAQLEHDLAVAGSGLGLRIGHKGTMLSGGQLQRLALARALAPRTELLIADDVSSALDVTTELDLWRAVRERGITVVGATAKRVALARADQVIVLDAGRMLDTGRWSDLESRWGHLAG